MKNMAVIGVLVLVLLLGAGGAAYYFLFRDKGESAEQPAVQTEAPKKVPVKQPKRSKREEQRMAAREAARTAREEAAKYDASIREGNDSLMRDPNVADKCFQDAIEIAKTDEQKARAWIGRVMVAKLTRNGALEWQAGKSLLALAPDEKTRATAYEAIAHGEKVRQNVQAALEAYAQATDAYAKSGEYGMACTTCVETARVMRLYAEDYQGATIALQKAFSYIDKSMLEDGRKKSIKWTLCLENADTCRLAGDTSGQIYWNREAIKYNPAWKQNADMIAREAGEKDGTTASAAGVASAAVATAAYAIDGEPTAEAIEQGIDESVEEFELYEEYDDAMEFEDADEIREYRELYDYEDEEEEREW